MQKYMPVVRVLRGATQWSKVGGTNDFGSLIIRRCTDLPASLLTQWSVHLVCTSMILGSNPDTHIFFFLFFSSFFSQSSKKSVAVRTFDFQVKLCLKKSVVNLTASHSLQLIRAIGPLHSAALDWC